MLNKQRSIQNKNETIKVMGYKIMIKYPQLKITLSRPPSVYYAPNITNKIEHVGHSGMTKTILFKK